MVYNSYEGTGRSLSLKLIQQLRQQSAQAQVSMTAENKTTTTAKLSSGIFPLNLLTVSCGICVAELQPLSPPPPDLY